MFVDAVLSCFGLRSPPRSEPPAPVVQQPCPEPAPKKIRPHITLSADKAVDLFLEWMADAWDETYLSAGQVDENWIAFSSSRGIYPISPGLIRENLKDRGYCSGRKYLAQPEYLHISHATGLTRAVIYRRPRKYELEARKRRATSAPTEGLPCAEAAPVHGVGATQAQTRRGRGASKPRKVQLKPRETFDGVVIGDEGRKAA